MRVYTPEQREAARLRAKKWYQEHPEQARASRKKWAASNRKKMQGYKKDWESSNPDYQREYQREYRRRQNRMSRCGIDDIRTEGVCEICAQHTTEICADHDHATGRFRGWLCHGCNRGIGLLKDSAEILDKAAAYLKQAAGLTNTGESDKLGLIVPGPIEAGEPTP